MDMKFSSRTNYLRPSAIRAFANFSLKSGVISFAGGSPAPESFPVDGLIKANQAVLKEKGRLALQYSGTDGNEELRKIILSHMEFHGIHGLEPKNILITNGSQQGLDYCGRLFIDDGDVVICEDPSYLGALNAFAAFGAEFAPAAMDEEGMIPEALEKVLKEYPQAKFIYTVPSFQNPTGITMSMARRKAILELSEKYGVPIVEDDPYGDLSYEGEAPNPIKSHDKNNNVIYLGTYSKTFCSGLRIGWIAASDDLIEKFTIIKQSTDLHTSTLSQMELAWFINNTDWRGHVEEVRSIYRAKRDLMVECMKRCFPDNVSFTFPHGGLFTWVTLPEDIMAEDVVKLAVENKVAFVPGAPFFANGGKHNHMRLSFSMCSLEDIRTGIERLGKVLHSL